LDIISDFTNITSRNPMHMDILCEAQTKLCRNAAAQKDFLEKLPAKLVPFFVCAGKSSTSWHSYVPTDSLVSSIAWETAPPLVTLSGEPSSKPHVGFLRKHLKMI